MKSRPRAKRKLLRSQREIYLGYRDRCGWHSLRRHWRHGTIFAVTPDGKSSIFYKSDQANIRSLAFDHQGNVIAGTEPDGRILRISKNAQQGKAREAFVVYETPNEEVTALLVDRAGNIYSASIGEKSRGAAPFATGGTSSPTTRAIGSKRRRRHYRDV